MLPAPGAATARKGHPRRLAAPEPYSGPGLGRASTLACMAACLTLSQRGHLPSTWRRCGQCVTPAQVSALDVLGIPALALTSLTPKEEVAAVYQRLDSDTSLRLVYGMRPIACIGECSLSSRALVQPGVLQHPRQPPDLLSSKFVTRLHVEKPMPHV